METAPLDDPKVGGWDPDLLPSTLDEIDPLKMPRFTGRVCSWCGSEAVLIGMGSVVYSPTDDAFHRAIGTRRACKNHISTLLDWKAEADKMYDRQVLEAKAREFVVWVMKTVHGWQMDDDGICWRGPKL